MKIQDIGVIYVGGFEYSVVSDAESDAYLVHAGLQAEHDGYYSVIKVSTAMDEQCTAQNLMHEVQHAIVRVYGARHTDEEGIEALSQGWFQVVRDNPGLLEFVTTAGVVLDEDVDEVE